MERRFSLSDGMILMLGLGLGLALMKASQLDQSLRLFWATLNTATPEWTGKRVFEAVLELTLVVGLPIGAGLTPCCLFFQKRGRPGYAACLIATVFVVPALVVIGVLVQLGGPGPDQYVGKLLFPTSLVGAAIFWSWLTLLFMGVWNPDPGWRDRLGRAMGVAWIVMGALCGYLVS